MDLQITQAVDLSSYTTQGSDDLRRQATEFLQSLHQNQQAAQVCLDLVTLTPKASVNVRLYALDVVNSALRGRYNPIDSASVTYIKDVLLQYIQREYYSDAATNPTLDQPPMMNKIGQTLTYIFTITYTTSWTTFFDEIIALTSTTTDEAGVPRRDNLSGVDFVLRLLGSIHDEIAEVLIARTAEESKRNTQIKDFVRDQDVQKLVSCWQEILAYWKGRDDRIIERTLVVVSRWVSWIDIGLVVNQVFLNLLFHFLEGQGQIRHAAIITLSEIAAKKMKPNDKLELIAFLNLTQVTNQLVALPEIQDRDSEEYEMQEAVAKLINTVVLDLIKILDGANNGFGTSEARSDFGKEATLSDQARQTTEDLLTVWVPHLLFFFANEYDDVTDVVYPALSDLYSLLRKEKKAKNVLIPSHQAMLEPALNVVVLKMKYDVDANWGGEGEEEEEADFLDLRKRLKTLQEAIASIDEDLYRGALANLVANTFDQLSSGTVDWRDLDLALYEMFLFGEVAIKNGGLFLEGGVPNGPSADVLVQMLVKMMECNLGSFEHPAIKLLFMEISVRYFVFFERRKDFITPALETFVRCVHDTHVKVKTRSWYLFQRFTKLLRGAIGNFAETVIGALGDLLEIKAELPTAKDDDDMSSDDGKAIDVFDSQLNLFEAIGVLTSSAAVPAERQQAVTEAVLAPIFADIQKSVPLAQGGDAKAILQVHDNIMAIGTFAKGYSDGSKGIANTDGVKLVSDELLKATEVIIASLESLRLIKTIREAASFTFSRMVGILGTRILPLLPRWIEGLLAENSTKEEMSVFLRLLDQLVHGFRNDIYDYLDKLLSPLLSRIFQSLEGPTEGTDDELHTAELRREYLNFLFVIMNNELSRVFMSDLNRGNFESLLQTVEHFAKNITDPNAERIAFSLMAKMSTVWGGPEIPTTVAAADKAQKPKSQIAVSLATAEPLPGFDRFMMERFSKTCWDVPATATFNVRDAQSRLVLSEAAALQKAIYGRTGSEFVVFLRGVYFPSINFPQAPAEEYLNALQQLDIKNFKKFFQSFVQQSVGG